MLIRLTIFYLIQNEGFAAYASAFVLLLRNAGIPARVVTGYQGGKRNPVDNYMIVRQSDAHAWTEVWLNDRGWVRVDPTAAVSPARIESGISDAGLEQTRLPAILFTDSSVIQQSRFILDSIHNSWNKWVIGYNQNTQKKLFNNMGVEEVDASKLVLWLVIAMTVFGIIAAGFLLRKRSIKNTDKILFYYNDFCNKFKSQGLTRKPHESENEFLYKIKQLLPDHARQAEIITNKYLQIRYNEQTGKRYIDNFIRIVKGFKLQKTIRN